MSQKFLIIFLSLLFISCDKGLSPDMAGIKVGFGGEVIFMGEWDKDVTQTHIVLFKEPLLSKEDFNVFNLKYVSDSIPNGTQLYKYSTIESSLIESIEPGEYSYLAVAQSKREVLSLDRKDWVVVGVYYNNGDTTKPGTLTLHEGEFIDSINIYCDFDNPPPQPPSGLTLQNLLKEAEQINNSIKKDL